MAKKRRRPSEFCRRALRVLDERGPLAPSDFARHMWPDTGNWVQTAVGQTGGAYLSWLERAGYINGDQTLTDQGRDALDG